MGNLYKPTFQDCLGAQLDRVLLVSSGPPRLLLGERDAPRAPSLAPVLVLVLVLFGPAAPGFPAPAPLLPVHTCRLHPALPAPAGRAAVGEPLLRVRPPDPDAARRRARRRRLGHAHPLLRHRLRHVPAPALGRLLAGRDGRRADLRRLVRARGCRRAVPPARAPCALCGRSGGGGSSRGGRR